jgi:hypothetical protein
VFRSEKSQWERFKRNHSGQFTGLNHRLAAIKQCTVAQVDPIKISDGHYAVHGAESLIAPIRSVSDNSHDAYGTLQKTNNYTSDGRGNRLIRRH